MKSKYVKLKVSIVALVADDVVTTSSWVVGHDLINGDDEWGTFNNQ